MWQVPKNSSAASEEVIRDPDFIYDHELYLMSQRLLSKSLPVSTSTHATFSIYLRWLEVQRQQPSLRTEHWSNTLLHWVQSLASREFSQDQVIQEVGRWKREQGLFDSKLHRSLPTESDIRRGYENYAKVLNEGRQPKRFDTYDDSKPVDTMVGGHDIYRPSGLKVQRRDENIRPDGSWKQREEALLQDWGRDEPRGDDFWREGSFGKSERKQTDQHKFDGPPPANYVCNRCSKRGHHLQVCPTNLDPAFDRLPDNNYRCEICHKRGDHFKSLCPENSDPYSITQKRKARGIRTPSKNSKSRILQDRVIISKTSRDSERLGVRATLRAKSSDSLLSWTPSSNYSSPSSARKLEIFRSLQNVEDRKQRLFREQSDEFLDMIQETTSQRSGDLKRAHSGDGSRSSGTDEPANSVYARKARKMDSLGMESPKQNVDMTEFMSCAVQKQDQDGKSDDASMKSERHVDTNGHHVVNSTWRKLSVALRPIEDSSESVDLYDSEGDNSDDVCMDELTMKPAIQYSPIVQSLMQRRPEMRQVVNCVRKRKTAQDMWEQDDQVRLKQPKTILDT
ncbi:putative protein MPE1 [Diplocarpon rosae]|nr:putative protein MPE1 [Diplocarpon rosae]